MKYKLILLIVLFLSLLSAQENLNNKFMLAQNYAMTGDYEKAKTIYLELVQKQPWNNQFLQELNKTYLQLKEYDSSINLLDNRIKLNPNDITFYGMLGTTYYTMGKSGKAFEVWDNALMINPGNAASYRVMANYALENRAFDKAIEILETGKSATNNPTVFTYELANLYSLTMKYSDATSEYLEIIKNQPDQLPVVKNRISIYINNHGAFDESINLIRKEAEADPSALDLLGFVYMQNDNYDEAFKVIKKIDETNSSGGSVLYNFAQGAFREKKYEICSKAFELFFERYPDSPLLPTAKLSYVQSLSEKVSLDAMNDETAWMPIKAVDTLGAYRFEPVLSAYDDLIAYYNNPDVISAATYGKAKILADKYNNLPDAKKLLNVVISSYPLSNGAVNARILMGELEIIDGNILEAEKYFDQAIKVRSNKDQKNYSLYMKARIKFWQNNFDEALSELDVITNDLSDDNANDALELISIINLFRNDSLNLAEYANADLLIFRKQFSAAESILKVLASNDKLFLLNDLAVFKLAQIKVAQNEFNPAIEILEGIQENELITAYSDKALFLLGNVYQFGVSNITKAEDSYKKLLEKFPNSLYFDTTRQILNVIRNKEKSR